MVYLPISYENLASIAATHDPSKPIYMLNLWKFKPNATYAPEHAAFAGLPCSGEEAVSRYRAALQPILPSNAEVFFVGTAIADIVAPRGESWDWVAIVRYESLEGFKKMVESEEYKEKAEPHKLAGMEEHRLIMMDKLGS